MNGTTTKYLWDGNVLLAEMDSTNAITKSYAFIPNGFEPIASTEGENTYWYLTDHLMTPQKLVDENQTITWGAEYQSFGRASITENIVENNLRFPGQYYDAETGLHYNWNRYY